MPNRYFYSLYLAIVAFSALELVMIAPLFGSVATQQDSRGESDPALAILQESVSRIRTIEYDSRVVREQLVSIVKESKRADQAPYRLEYKCRFVAD